MKKLIIIKKIKIIKNKIESLKNHKKKNKKKLLKKQETNPPLPQHFSGQSKVGQGLLVALSDEVEVAQVHVQSGPAFKHIFTQK